MRKLMGLLVVAVALVFTAPACDKKAEGGEKAAETKKDDGGEKKADEKKADEKKADEETE